MLAVCRHWEGMIEVNALHVGIEPVWLAALVGFTLGAKYKKALLALSGPGLFQGHLLQGSVLVLLNAMTACTVLRISLWLQFSGRRCFTVAYFDMGRCSPLCRFARDCSIVIV